MGAVVEADAGDVVIQVQRFRHGPAAALAAAAREARLYLRDAFADGVEHLQQGVAGGALVDGVLGTQGQIEDGAHGRQQALAVRNEVLCGPGTACMAAGTSAPWLAGRLVHQAGGCAGSGLVMTPEGLQSMQLMQTVSMQHWCLRLWGIQAPGYRCSGGGSCIASLARRACTTALRKATAAAASPCSAPTFCCYWRRTCLKTALCIAAAAAATHQPW